MPDTATIYALASGIGRAGVAVIGVVGPAAGEAGRHSGGRRAPDRPQHPDGGQQDRPEAGRPPHASIDGGDAAIYPVSVEAGAGIDEVLQMHLVQGGCVKRVMLTPD